MTIAPELSQQLITLLSVRDPVSVSNAIDLILSICPDRNAEDLIFQIQCVDDSERVVPHEEIGLPNTTIKAD